MLKKNKKGFTLAELLIVVAIIAVLTAIAVPLFVGSLKKANDSVLAANQRAVRGYAVAEILGDTTDKYTTTESSGEKVLKGPWYVHAEVSASGEISNLKIYKDGDQNAQDTLYKNGENKKDGDIYKINLKIEVLKAA